MYDYFISVYEGSWLYGQQALQNGNEVALRKGQVMHEKLAARARRIAELSEQVIVDNSDLKERHIALFDELAEAFEDLIPAIIEDRLHDVAHPERLATRARMLDNDISALAV